MTSGFHSLIRRAANGVGLEIRRHRPEASEFARLATMLSNHNVNLVLDVGANTGQFAMSLRQAGYAGSIVSFEPLLTAYSELLKASACDPQWQIAPQGAIGDEDGEIEIHIAGNSVSSSALAMLKSHAEAVPESAYVNHERVPISRLDTVAGNYMKAGTVPFLKIDTQGYEDRVLDGAPSVVAQSAGLQLELSFLPLYEGQQLFHPLVERLSALGFVFWAIYPGFSEPRSGRMLQVDATFFRNDSDG